MQRDHREVVCPEAEASKRAAQRRLGPAGGLKLAAMLRNAVSLRALDVADNALGAMAVCALAQVLRGMPALTRHPLWSWAWALPAIWLAIRFWIRSRPW